MTIALLTNIISPHRIPLSEELVSLVGSANYRYYYTDDFHSERANMGWGSGTGPGWCVPFRADGDAVENVELLISGHRDWKLLQTRASRRLFSIYASERWFKPKMGFLRLLDPRYFKMAMQFVRMLGSSDYVYYFPQGIHAARDMARLCGLMHGDLRCLFRSPKLDFERKPGGKIWLKNGGDNKKYCLYKMRMWGYFVAPSQLPQSQLTHSPTPNSPTLKVLWVGRFLNWKRVDTIIRAVGELSKSHSSTPQLTHSPTPNSPPHPLTLALYGTGPEEKRLKKLAAKYGDCIKFYPPVPIAEVRKLMREHNVYVLASNAYEGWGAVVNEALEEGMKVIGTDEAGSSATILPAANLFHAGDWNTLKCLIERYPPQVNIGKWAPKSAAHELIAFYKTIKEG